MIRLKSREKRMVLLASLVILSLAYYLFVVSPTFSRQKSLDRSMVKAKSDLQEMRSLKAKWEAFQSVKAQAEKRTAEKGKGFSMMTFLEDVSKETAVASKVKYLKPITLPEEQGGIRGEAIEMSIEGISTLELVSVLHKIEYSGQFLSVKRVKIQKTDAGSGLLKVLLQVGSFMSN